MNISGEAERIFIKYAEVTRKFVAVYACIVDYKIAFSRVFFFTNKDFLFSFGDRICDLFCIISTHQSISRHCVAAQCDEIKKISTSSWILRGSRKVLLHSTHKHVLWLRHKYGDRIGNWHSLFHRHTACLHIV